MKSTNKFSVITTVHLWNDYRVAMFKKCIDSLKAQTKQNFEWVIVDDGSTHPFDWNSLLILPFPVKLIRKSHEERVIALNEAFRQAEGEWFVLLDSDDELEPNALQVLTVAIHSSPRFKMFNFGCTYHHKDGGEAKRGPFKPKRKRGGGHAEFSGGNIVNGTFIFHRSIYDKLGAYGEALIKDIDTSSINYGGVRDLYLGSPYDFAAWFLLTFPEQRKYFLVDHQAEPEKIIKEIGNPWGQDHALFYKYTRKYYSKPLEKFLYIVNPR